jgi:hypothetical protein
MRSVPPTNGWVPVEIENRGGSKVLDDNGNEVQTRMFAQVALNGQGKTCVMVCAVLDGGGPLSKTGKSRLCGSTRGRLGFIRDPDTGSREKYSALMISGNLGVFVAPAEKRAQVSQPMDAEFPEF